MVEVFLAAFNNEALTSLPAERQLAWLMRVARNKMVDRYRHLALRALEQLLPLQRELIRLRYTKSLRFFEIARIFEKSEGAVRKLYARTLQQLRGIYYQTEGGKQR